VVAGRLVEGADGIDIEVAHDRGLRWVGFQDDGASAPRVAHDDSHGQDAALVAFP